MSDFPAERLRRGGATEEELAALEREFDFLPSEEARAGYVSQLDQISDSDIATMLDARREAAGAAPETPEDGPETGASPEAEGSTPEATSGA